MEKYIKHFFNVLKRLENENNIFATRENFHKIKNHARIFMRKDFYLKSNV